MRLRVESVQLECRRFGLHVETLLGKQRPVERSLERSLQQEWLLSSRCRIGRAEEHESVAEELAIHSVGNELSTRLLVLHVRDGGIVESASESRANDDGHLGDERQSGIDLEADLREHWTPGEFRYRSRGGSTVVRKR